MRFPQPKEGVSQWAAHVVSLGAMTGLVGCCGRFTIHPDGTFRDAWPEQKYPLSDWDFVHGLGLTMHFVITVDQRALLNQSALLAVPEAVKASPSPCPGRSNGLYMCTVNAHSTHFVQFSSVHALFHHPTHPPPMLIATTHVEDWSPGLGTCCVRCTQRPCNRRRAASCV